MATEQQEILEIVRFLKDNAPTKKEMHDAIHGAIAESEGRISARFDRIEQNMLTVA